MAVVGSENEFGPCRDSIESIVLRAGDYRAPFIRATKGFEARQMHINNWYNEQRHEFILLLDSDMIFPPDTLEKLRAHQKPFVSGFYMRRIIKPVAPVWFFQGAPGELPMKPMTAVLEKDKWFPIGASGWGCMLMHRDVVTETRKLLKGEPDILEDDMDVYPYDLQRVLTAIEDIQNNPAEAQKVLREEIRLIKHTKNEIVGSDIRFPFYARLAGFELIGDTGVLCGHVAPYTITIDDWLSQPAHYIRDISLYMNKAQVEEKERMNGK